MPTHKLSPYRQKVSKVKHALRLQGSSLAEWASQNGYTSDQVYATTRRERVSDFGISREIAEKLNFITKENTHA